MGLTQQSGTDLRGKVGGPLEDPLNVTGTSKVVRLAREESEGSAGILGGAADTLKHVAELQRVFQDADIPSTLVLWHISLRPARPACGAGTSPEASVMGSAFLINKSQGGKACVRVTPGPADSPFRSLLLEFTPSGHVASSPRWTGHFV